MSEQVTDQASELLAKIADKLGTTVEALWQIMVTGARVEGIYATVMVGFGVLCWFAASRFLGKAMKDDDRKPPAPAFAALFLFIVGVVFVVEFGYEAVVGVWAPEYLALQRLLKIL